MKGYDDLFALRGAAYDRAVHAFPGARRQEFLQAIERMELTTGMVVADVPAGGGYLRQYLPPGCEWWPHEPCASFTVHSLVTNTMENGHLLPLPWLARSVDAAFSIAGIHHLEDKRPLFAELHRVVKPCGALLLSDVAAGSAVAHFLDSYVGTYNSTGHEGIYLDEKTLQELNATGWQVELCEVVNFHWLFPETAAMADFCHQLFDITRSTPAQTEEAILQHLGIINTPDGVGMQWSLMTIRARRQ
jgi:SAM-dependent methyltransferase